MCSYRLSHEISQVKMYVKERASECIFQVIHVYTLWRAKRGISVLQLIKTCLRQCDGMFLRGGELHAQKQAIQSCEKALLEVIQSDGETCFPPYKMKSAQVTPS